MTDNLWMTIEARVEVIFDDIAKALGEWNDRALLPSGVILTGGGSLLRHIEDGAERALGMPARLARARYGGEHQDIATAPGNAVAMGLIGLGMQARQQTESERKGFWQRLKIWSGEFSVNA